MRVSVQVLQLTAHVADSAQQVADVFGHAAASMAESQPGFRQFGELAISLSLMDGPSQGRGSGSYHADNQTFYASAGIDYPAWVVADWGGRVAAMADATAKAVRAVHKTRIDPDERAALLAVVEDARAMAAANPPEALAAIKPVYLVYTGDAETPSISYREPLEVPGMTKVIPMAALEAAAYLETWRADVQAGPTSFKLYQRMDGRLCYHEAWPAEGCVMEHRGVCGERGETRDHPAPDAKAQMGILKTLKAEARALGFRPIAPSRHHGLLVEVALDGFGDAEDVERRHALQDFLDEVTGWLGLGHCDGGSTGSGSMEAFCLVVDFPLAKAAIEAALVGSPFADFTVRRGDF